MKSRVSGKGIGLSVLVVGVVGFVLIYFLTDLSAVKGPAPDAKGIPVKKPVSKDARKPSVQAPQAQRKMRGPLLRIRRWILPRLRLLCRMGM